MGAPWKLQFLQDEVRQQRPLFIFLCETLSSKAKMEWVRSRVGFQGMVVVEAAGRSGGFALLLKNQDQINLCSLSKNHIDVEIMHHDSPAWCLTSFYGEPNRSQRKRTWGLLSYRVTPTSHGALLGT